MEAAVGLSLQSCSLIGGAERAGRRSRPANLRVSLGCVEGRGIQAISLRGSRPRSWSVRTKGQELKVSCCYKEAGARSLPNFNSSVDEALELKRKAENVIPFLNGRCIYLVGMMGSGKTTVGKILAEVLGYSFFDSDKLVEQAVGISSVAQIFKEHSEAFFRENESEVLRDLSSMSRLIVATGGGAVIRPVNWKYMKQGITIWLDVPLEALAERIAAVGTASRPLLNQEEGDPYTKAFKRLSVLFKERGGAYSNADARVCLQSIADKQGHRDISSLTPTVIATEALVKTESFLSANVPAGRFSCHQGRGIDVV